MDQIEEIKQKLNIVDVVSTYTPLKKAGMNFKAICPFHAEKTPSFMVSPEKQIWHCFGCGEGGDIFGFVMKMEGVEFPEALRVLAKKSGVKLQRSDPTIINKKTRLYEISEQAKDYFKKMLFNSASSPFGKASKNALEYLKKREFSEKTIVDFELGYAPDSFDALSNFLKQKGYKDEEIFNAGLSVKKDRGGYYDRFRGRIMFPIFNLYGDTIGFGARLLDDKKTDKGGKYINTPQTLIYDKSRVIYGLHKAKNDIRKSDKIVVVEGYMDVIPSHQAGVLNVVSSSGTALTEGQLDIISRYTKNINLAFDVDTAGDTATYRGIELALAKGLNVKIVQIPAGSDPDECIKQDVSLWKKAISESLYFIDFYFQNVFSKIKNKILTVEDKRQVAAKLLPIIKKIPDKIEQSHYVQKLAAKLDTPEKIIYDAISNIKIQKRTYTSEEKPIKEKKSKNQIRFLQQRLLGLVLNSPEFIKHLVTNLEADYFTFPDLKEIYTQLQSFYTKFNDDFDLKKFTEKLNSDLSYKVDMITLEIDHFYPQIDKKVIVEEIDSYILRLKKIKLKKEKKELEEEIKKAENQGDKKKIASLIKKFQKIAKEDK